MDRDRTQATPIPVDRGGQNLLQRSELLGNVRLKVKRKLELGNRRNHMFPVLSDPTEKKSGSVSGRIEVGTQQVPRNLAQSLESQDTPSGDTPRLAPLGNRALIDPKFARDGALPASGLYRMLHEICPHEFMLITEIDRRDNTESDRRGWHASDMNRVRTQTSFWDRLQEAAKANGIEPSQSAIARDLKVRQSAVAKWKAGGRPKTTRIEEIAQRWKFNVNWLMNEDGPKRPAGVGEPDDTAELLRLWKSLTPPARKAILEQVRVIRSLTQPAKQPETT